MPQEANTNNRQARSQATQTALMRAAEKLIAERGIASVSIREIVNAAGQKNESALQYHFKNFAGLIAAIHKTRSEQIEVRRAKLLDELRAQTHSPELRQICALMVQPAFELAQSQPDFRRYVKAFGHEMAMTSESALSMASHKGGESAEELGGMLQAALQQLNPEAFRRRMESAVRFCSVSMAQQARVKNAFRGLQAELFFRNLIDALVGLLGAPESDETRKIAEQISNH